MKGTQPPDWDWVTARHDCSAVRMFQLLRVSVAKNVEVRNAQLKAIDFELKEYSAVHFAAYCLRTSAEPNAVDFCLKDETITVRHGYRSQECVLTVTLDDRGECLFRVDNQELLEPWQVLKRALEPLLFGGPV